MLQVIVGILEMILEHLKKKILLINIAGGIYTVKLTASNDSESIETTKQVTVIDSEPAPSAGFNVETTGLSAAFTNTSTSATSYSWDFGDSTGSSTDENPNYTYAQSGTYTVTLTASNDTESVQYSEEVTVEDETAAPVAGFTVETNLNVTFTNTSANATSYAWDFGDGPGTSADENPNYRYTSAGTYTVTLTAKNGESDLFTSEVTYSCNSPTLLQMAHLMTLVVGRLLTSMKLPTQMASNYCKWGCKI